MTAAANERGPQKICFFDWLVNEINSGKYEGLYWLDENHTIFRIPWKHNARKDLVSSDYMIFKEWAMVSRKYNEAVQDPTKWKTNFRCALNSTKRFEEVKSNEPDFHRYRIITTQPNNAPAANLPADTNNGSNPVVDINPCNEGVPVLHQPTPLVQQEINDAFGTLTLGNPAPVPNGNTPGNFNHDTLQWVMHQAQLNLGGIQPVSWNPALGNHPVEETLYAQNDAYAVPEMDQPFRNEKVNEPVVANNCYEEPVKWLVQNVVNSQSFATVPLQQAQQTNPATNQYNPVGEALHNNNCFIENVFMDEEPEGEEVIMNSDTRNGCHMGAGQQPMMEEGICALPALTSTEPPANTAPLQNNIAFPLRLDVSIYYRGRLLCELQVEESSCVFTYNHHYAHVPCNAQIIVFPGPEGLPDEKQACHTLTVLQETGLLLYQKNEKLCAKRLGKSKVFWAFSKQLNNMAEPRMLPRDEDIEIFNYEKFLQELKKFMSGQIRSSPDYTIYLCFGQRLSASKPKDSKLILVKLVSRVCKCWHEQSQREGASSLNTENDSLQISNSLYDMIEQLSTSYLPREVP
nr:interferon regulatory factor 7 [Pogona vitticeps]XP_020639823.1 interferon regulatory factor 7 [Pogona vitticeps]XP_020639824.1 interferon regulatory factor 7 [Pogona vitticeps]XP_020639825.1 interferon regulatory factor 7 [Pogona vitticeps]